VSQRRKFLAGNLLNYQSVAIALASQTRDRHSAHRKRDLHGISKAKRSIRRNFRLRSIYHRRFRKFGGSLFSHRPLQNKANDYSRLAPGYPLVKSSRCA
jgi:hypothetical protein